MAILQHLIDTLEPATADRLRKISDHPEDFSGATIDAICEVATQHSIAISMKRIADTLEEILRDQRRNA